MLPRGDIDATLRPATHGAAERTRTKTRTLERSLGKAYIAAQPEIAMGTSRDKEMA
jgi:hypothetical protein